MSVRTTLCSVFGYHTEKTIPGPAEIRNEHCYYNAKDKACKFNAANVSGYFPILGLGGAAEHLVQVFEDKDAESSAKAGVLMRAFCEGAGAGLIFLPVDGCVSLIRFDPCFVRAHTYEKL